MDNVDKKVFYFFAALVLIMLLFGGALAASVYYLGQYRNTAERYRAELERATNREQYLESTVAECLNGAERAGEILGRTVSSVAELREQLRKAKEEYDRMEGLLRSVRDNGSDDNSCTDIREEVSRKG